VSVWVTRGRGVFGVGDQHQRLVSRVPAALSPQIASCWQAGPPAHFGLARSFAKCRLVCRICPCSLSLAVSHCLSSVTVQIHSLHNHVAAIDPTGHLCPPCLFSSLHYTLLAHLETVAAVALLLAYRPARRLQLTAQTPTGFRSSREIPCCAVSWRKQKMRQPS
jgi:hypothetical protein